MGDRNENRDFHSQNFWYFSRYEAGFLQRLKAISVSYKSREVQDEN